MQKYKATVHFLCLQSYIFCLAGSFNIIFLKLIFLRVYYRLHQDVDRVTISLLGIAALAISYACVKSLS